MLQRAKDVATRHGGLCLSDRYADGRDQARWRCARGHEWQTAFRLVLGGSWCPTCMRAQGDANRRVVDGLQRLQALAVSRGGQCLSDSYLGNTVRYRMRCAEGREWDALGSSLQRGSWCAMCHQGSRRKGLEAMLKVAAARGGQCLSSQYRHCAQKLTWLCDRGHIWQASWASIQRHWCPECAHMGRITNAASKARRRYGVDTRLALDPAVDPAPAPAQAVSPTTTAEA